MIGSLFLHNISLTEKPKTTTTLMCVCVSAMIGRADIEQVGTLGLLRLNET